jgi:hypothetical protein
MTMARPHATCQTIRTLRLTSGWTATIALCAVAGCYNVPAMIVQEATARREDPQCVAALKHLQQCDARWPVRTILCEYTAGGECAPYVNPSQSECLRAATCEEVRAALDRRGWLCGLSPSSAVAGSP